MLLIQSLFAKSYSKHKDVSYSGKNQLDIYTPGEGNGKRDVLVFFHGGAWNSGSKDTYWFLGRNFAKKGVITVVVNYRMAPQVLIDSMAKDCAASIRWVQEHIAEYGGDPERIFISGHSAGGHLAALIAADKEYLGQNNPVKACILIDAFGLDMDEYLHYVPASYSSRFYDAFTDQEKNWKKFTPAYYLQGSNIPFTAFTGGWTYANLIKGNLRFKELLQEAGKEMSIKVIPRKRHVGMMRQFLWTWKPIYKDILSYMQSH